MKKSEKIVSIDLGSYNSCISVYEGNEIKVIPNSEGGLTTPSYVAFTKDGTQKVGEPAKRQSVTNPENTIFNIKRLMGKTYEQVKHLKRPYQIVDSKGRAAVKVNDRIYSPEEISAIILQKMKKSAEDYLGEEITRAIITVPAYFNSEERDATKTAGEIAGFKVERIIAEPTAAILNIDANSSKSYAVFDFGGTTFDMSIIDVGSGVFEVLSTNGDLDLGGSLIDEKIVNWLADEFKSECQMDLRKDPMALQRLFEASEKAKIELSGSATADINLPYITSIDNVPKHLVKTLSRAKFDQLVEDIIDRTIAISKVSIDKSKIDISKVDEILLVGGSSRIPLVQTKLENLFKKKPSKTLNPDLCVSTGGCVQGGIISGDVKDVLLLDVNPISIGIETMGGVMTKLIEENTTIPTSKEDTFTTAADNQSSVEIHVLQGERPMAKDCKSLGKFTLDSIPPSPRGIPQILVNFSVDVNGILTVTATDKATKKSNSIRIEGGSKLSKEEIEKMKQEAKDNAETDKKEKEKIDKTNQADSLIFQTEKQLKEFDDKLSQDQKDKLTISLSSLKEAFKEKDFEKMDSCSKNLNEIWNEISTEMYKNSQNQQTADPTTEKTNAEASDVPFEEVK